MDKKRTFHLDTIKPSSTPDDVRLQQAKDVISKVTEATAQTKAEQEDGKTNPVAESATAENEPAQKNSEEDDEAIDLFLQNLRKIQRTLNNKEYQEAIKNACGPLSISSMIQHGEFRQTVPIAGKEFTVEFRSVSSAEDLALKKIMASKDYVSERHFTDLYTMYQQAMGIVAVNKTPLPSHLSKSGEVDSAKLEEKLKYILSFPIQVSAIIGIHYYWFDLRVRDLFDIERAVAELKNG